MNVFFAADHAGFELKQELIPFVAELGYGTEDLGAHTLELGDDYPSFMRAAAERVAADPENARAIILGKSGEGEAMAANRVKGIRAAVYYGGAPEILVLSREHNDANILSLGAGFLSIEEAQRAVKKWLATAFSGEERHRRRIAELDL